MDKKEILKILDNILDPDLGNRSIVELGFVSEEDIEISAEEIHIAYTVGGPLCPYSAAVGIIIKQILKEKFPQIIKVRLKEEHYQQQIVNQILNNESQFQEWWEKIKNQNLLSKTIRSFAPSI